ncbi:MAG: MmcQ/YjbR family DNA-binding protein [Bacteroidetes bacterium]|nr:MmcQ/YjbR family DNA-binding protein [Bacteroidota bacterium]
MVSIENFRKLALSFPEASEAPHFHLASFRTNKKIFTTLWEKENRAMIKLPLSEQSVFCDYDKAVFFPVPGKWGLKGATFVDLGKVNKTVLKEALTIAYEQVIKKK